MFAPLAGQHRSERSEQLDTASSAGEAIQRRRGLISRPGLEIENAVGSIFESAPNAASLDVSELLW
jgi:hypothetical protein